MSKKEVIIYTWRRCPYCVKAKRILNQEGILFEEVEISNDNEMLTKLEAKTGSGTVPQLFVDGVFVGGCDDLEALVKNSEEFKRLFK